MSIKLSDASIILKITEMLRDNFMGSIEEPYQDIPYFHVVSNPLRATSLKFGSIFLCTYFYENENEQHRIFVRENNKIFMMYNYKIDEIDYRRFDGDMEEKYDTLQTPTSISEAEEFAFNIALNDNSYISEQLKLIMYYKSLNIDYIFTFNDVSDSYKKEYPSCDFSPSGLLIQLEKLL